jgi:GT2 family glycosyltransferase
MQFVAGPAAVALVIPTRDRVERLLRTLERIAGTPGPNVEVVVADNGSIDGTPTKVRRAFPAVKVIELQRNLGTAARNQAAREAASPLIFMLDDDSGPEPGAVEAVVAALADSTVGVAACLVALPGGRFEEGGSRHVHVGCGAGFRRTTLLELGGYPAEYECYVEEYDLAFGALAAGLDVRFAAGARVWHEPAARESYDYMVEKLTANNAYLAVKFLPPAEAVRHIAWTLYRYGRFAEHTGAQEGFRRACEALPEKISRGERAKTPLPDRALDRVLPHRDTAATFRSLVANGERQVTFLRAGKEIPGLLRAARAAGLEVAAILEPKDGLLAKASAVFDAPIKPIAPNSVIGALVGGGTSPGFALNTLALAAEAGLPEPVTP